MKLPKRYREYKNADVRFSRFMINLVEEYRLTNFEVLQLFTSYQQRIVKDALKDEWGDSNEHGGPKSGRQEDGD